jgi:phage terminase small subunit
MAKLTLKQQMFVKEYLVDLNGTQAAIRAGYSERTATEIAHEYLRKPHIVVAVEEAMNKRAEKTGITAERVLNEIAKMAFLDPRKLFDSDGKPLHITALDDDTAASIAGLDVVTTGSQDAGFGEVMKIKLADKAKNLELLGRHLKLFTDKQEITGKDGGAQQVEVSMTVSALSKVKQKTSEMRQIGNATVSVS